MPFRFFQCLIYVYLNEAELLKIFVEKTIILNKRF